MQLSKIGSKNTYHKCIKELHTNGYIIYNPPLTKFQPVKISLIRLDIKEEQQSVYHQLDLFDTINPENKKSVNTKQRTNIDTPAISHPKSDSTKIDTVPVPYLTLTSTAFDTAPVPKMGHNIKHKEFIKESKQPPQKFSKKNESQKQTNPAGPVPKSVHIDPTCHPTLPDSFGNRTDQSQQSREGSARSLTVVQQFFKQNDYPEAEANKFFNHYQSIG